MMLYFVLTLNREKKLMSWSFSFSVTAPAGRLITAVIISALRDLARIVISHPIVIHA